MSLVLVYLGFGEHCLDHFVNILVRLVVAVRFLVFEVEAYIAGSLMPEF